MSTRIEMISVVLVALAVMAGGQSLLGSLVAHHAVAMPILALLAVLQFWALRRNYAEGGPGMRVRATRDVAFFSAILFALALTAWPQHWSVGATIAATEFGLVLDLLSRYAPTA